MYQQCPKCGFLAPSKNQLTQHRRKFHGKQTTYAPQVQGQIVANAVAATTTGTNASGKKVSKGLNTITNTFFKNKIENYTTITTKSINPIFPDIYLFYVRLFDDP